MIHIFSALFGFCEKCLKWKEIEITYNSLYYVEGGIWLGDFFHWYSGKPIVHKNTSYENFPFSHFLGRKIGRMSLFIQFLLLNNFEWNSGWLVTVPLLDWSWAISSIYWLKDNPWFEIAWSYGFFYFFSYLIGFRKISVINYNLVSDSWQSVTS